MEDVLAYWLGPWSNNLITIQASMAYCLACCFVALNMVRP
jgi:hypothetical protein